LPSGFQPHFVVLHNFDFAEEGHKSGHKSPMRLGWCLRNLLILIWLPPRDSNPDMLIQSQISPTENKENKDLHSAKRDQTRQNTQTGRKRKDEAQS
jgi:hypothetical protein